MTDDDRNTIATHGRHADDIVGRWNPPASERPRHGVLVLVRVDDRKAPQFAPHFHHVDNAPSPEPWQGESRNGGVGDFLVERLTDPQARIG